MEKKRLYGSMYRKIGLWKTFLVMRLTVFFMFCFIVGGHATGLSQYRLSMKLGDTTFKQLFEEIRKQTGCIVMYSDDMLDKNERVKADFSDESLEQVLDVVLAGKGLRYEKNAEFITIMKAVLPQATEARTITGKVKDTQGNTVPGVSVFIKGTTVGVATDADGLFKLTIPEQKDIVLVFSFVGMKTQEVALKNQKEINIVMEEDAKVMDEVVVTGIFERKKEGFTGSATTVTGEEIKKLTSNNVLRALSMIDPGFRMNVSNVAGSNPNALPDFEMRGQANMGNYDGEDVVIMRGDIDTRPNQPLFVLDGIIGVGISTIIDLDPDRIESITILKDAAAMVVYGSRASNGVVVVETKAPEKGKLRFSYSGNYKYQTPDLSVYHLLNAADKLELERQAGYYDERYTASNASNLQNFYLAKYLDVQRGVNTDWIAQPVRTAFNHRHSFNLEGGDNTLRYKLYFGINQAPGVMKGTGVDTKSGSIDLRYRTNKLLVSNQLSIDFTVGDRTSPYGTFQTYTMLNPYYRIYDENGAISKVLDNHVYSTDGYVSYIGGYSTPTMNPMYNIQFHQKDQNKQFQVRNSFRAEYTPIESLRISADITLTKTEEDLEQFKPSSHTDFEGLAVEDRGSYNWTHNKGTNYNVSLTASYNKVFNSDHLVSVFARYDIDERYTHAAGVNVKGFPNDKMDEVFLGNEPTTTSGDEGTNRSIGFVSTVNYSYKQRYAVDGSIRIDGSSEFGRNNRFAPFWSAGVRWNMDKENFIKSLGFVDEFVLRGTYGITGSQGFSPYQSLQMYSYDGMMKLYHSSDVAGSVLMSMGNPDLKWQQTRNWNVGLDFNFFRGFVSGRVEYYKKFTKNTLLDFTLAPSIVFETIKDNLGDIDNKGYELTLRIMPYNNLKKQMNFNIVLNGSHNDNRIARISNALKVRNAEAAEKVTSRPLPKYVEGYSQSIIWGVRSLGIDPTSGREILLTRDGKRTFDWNALDQVPLGDTEPTLQGTLSANFNWKGLSVSLIGGYKFGGQMYNYTLIEKVENANLRMNVDERAFTDRWKKPGDKTFFKGVTTDVNGQSTKASSRFVMDNNEFTLSTLNVSYRFERRYHDFIRKVGLSSASVALYLEDLVRLSTIKMERGIDYPFSRQVSMSLSLVF